VEKPPAYGVTRERAANVSYQEIERAALDTLAGGQRPSVETLRKRLGRGSPATIAGAMRRFWKDLGTRAAGDPAALTRLPPDIVDLADGMWQKALALAGLAAKHDDNAARERLQQLQLENEVRAQSYAMREKEFDTASREREKALSETREQVSSLMKELAIDRETMRAQVARIIELGSQVEDYRRQLATLVTRAVTRHRALAGSTPKRQPRTKRRRKMNRPAVPKKPTKSTRKLARKPR
jgi:plasmid replication DNA-binding protein KfrA